MASLVTARSRDSYHLFSTGEVSGDHQEISAWISPCGRKVHTGAGAHYSALLLWQKEASDKNKIFGSKTKMCLSLPLTVKVIRMMSYLTLLAG